MVSLQEGIEILKKVLSKLSKELDPNSTNIIDKIKENLKQSSPVLYEQWQNSKFDVNHLFEPQDGTKFTLLHVAAEVGHKDVVEFLLENKADINAKNNEGYTALHVAASKGYKNIVDFLLKSGAKINEKTNDGCTALHIAASSRHGNVVELLLKKGSNPYEKKCGCWLCVCSFEFWSGYISLYEWSSCCWSNEYNFSSFGGCGGGTRSG